MTIAITPPNVQNMAAVFRMVSKIIQSQYQDTGDSHIQPGQPLVTKGRYGVAKEGDAKEDEINLVRFASEDANSRFFLKDIDTGDEEEGGAKVDSQGDADIAYHVKPAADPAGHPAPTGW